MVVRSIFNPAIYDPGCLLVPYFVFVLSVFTNTFSFNNCAKFKVSCTLNQLQNDALH